MSYLLAYVLISSLCYVQRAYGVTDFYFEGRIVKGYQVEIQSYPHSAFLHFQNTFPSGCGGSIIIVNAIITAAHCFDELRYRKGHITAFLGSTIPINSNAVRRVRKYRTHPNFNPESGKFNLGVGYVHQMIPLGKTIQKIPIAINAPETNAILYTSGWGKQVLCNVISLSTLRVFNKRDSLPVQRVAPIYTAGVQYGQTIKNDMANDNLKEPDRMPDYSEMRHLKASKQRVISSRKCQKFTGHTIKHQNASSPFWCTASVNGYHYQGDAGNGLVSTDKFLIGVVSHMINEVTIYSDVIHQTPWIWSSVQTMANELCAEYAPN